MKEKILIRIASFLAAIALWSFMTAVSAQTAVEYIHTDALGTPVAVTDAAGVVIERSEYEPYGQLVNRPLTDGPGYTGHVQDAATGLTYMQQRYYDPMVGRFLSVDPVAAIDSSEANFNKYWYAANSPQTYFDPDGRLPKFFEDDKKEENEAPPPPPAEEKPPITDSDPVIVRPLPEYTASGVRALYSCRQLGTCVSLDQVRRGDQWVVGGLAATAGGGAVVAACVGGGCQATAIAVGSAANSKVVRETLFYSCIIIGVCNGGKPSLQRVNQHERLQQVREGIKRDMRRKDIEIPER